MSNPTGAFIWYELMTVDADGAQAFYRSVVGWQVTASGMPGMDYRLLNAGEQQVGGLMQLSDEMLGGGARPAWFGYVAVDDTDEAVRKVAAAGGSVHVPPSDIPNIGRFAMVADPQGNLLYVLNDTSGATSRAFEPGTVGHCAWNELITPDASGVLEFYSRQFGWQLGETMPAGNAGDYLIFNLGDASIGGIMPATSEQPPAMWRFYFRVSNLGTAAEKVRAGGGQVVYGPADVPGNDEIVIAIDPQGALFGLVAARG